MTAVRLPRRGGTIWLAALALWIVTAGATPASSGTAAKAVDVAVRHARLRWLPGDLPLAGYFELTNTGQRSLRLVGAASPAFTRVTLHRSAQADGTQHMEHVSGVDVAPGKTLRFAPGGYHLMLMKRRRRLAVGDRVPVRLRFADGREANVDFTVRGAGTQ